MLAARRVWWVMEEGYFPLRSVFRQFAVQPVNLLFIHVIAVQAIERSVAFSEPVVILPFHVEMLIHALRDFIMVPERRIKLSFLVQQRAVGIFNFFLVVRRLFAAVKV